MAISNIRKVLTNVGADPQYTRTERTGFHAPFYQDVEVVIFDKLTGDVTLDVPTALRVEDGHVQRLDTGALIAAASVLGAIDGYTARLAGLDNSTGCILTVYGNRLP